MLYKRLVQQLSAVTQQPQCLQSCRQPRMLQGRHWIINSIDGIEGFESLRQYGISMALLEQGKVIRGCCCCSHAARHKHHSFHATVPHHYKAISVVRLSDCRTSCNHGSCQWYWPQAHTMWFVDYQSFGQWRHAFTTAWPERVLLSICLLCLHIMGF